MTRRATPVCVDCGAHKGNVHVMAQRCGRCDPVFKAAMNAANVAVATARRHGHLCSPKTLACLDCGGAAMDYDHRDYSKPLTVEPVCRACNFKRGPALYVRAPVEPVATA